MGELNMSISSPNEDVVFSLSSFNEVYLVTDSLLLQVLTSTAAEVPL